MKYLQKYMLSDYFRSVSFFVCNNLSFYSNLTHPLYLSTQLQGTHSTPIVRQRPEF